MPDSNSKQGSLLNTLNNNVNNAEGEEKFPETLYFFFDTETTGLPKNYHAPHEDLDNWPRIVQVAWLIANEKKEILNKKSFIIKPDGFNIPIASSNIHGIDDAKANQFGIPLAEALNIFNENLNQSNPTLVAHNIDFDINVLGAEFLRTNINTNFMDLSRICTMKSTIDFCNLPNRKYPKLIELYRRLFADDFIGAHDALADVSACYECFFELKKRNIIADTFN
jgi:DNA polymerase III epsilon subunit-like protein